MKVSNLFWGRVPLPTREIALEKITPPTTRNNVLLLLLKLRFKVKGELTPHSFHQVLLEVCRGNALVNIFAQK